MDVLLFDKKHLGLGTQCSDWTIAIFHQLFTTVWVVFQEAVWVSSFSVVRFEVILQTELKPMQISYCFGNNYIDV